MLTIGQRVIYRNHLIGTVTQNNPISIRWNNSFQQYASEHTLPLIKNYNPIEFLHGQFVLINKELAVIQNNYEVITYKTAHKLIHAVDKLIYIPWIIVPEKTNPIVLRRFRKLDHTPLDFDYIGQYQNPFIGNPIALVYQNNIIKLYQNSIITPITLSDPFMEFVK